MEVYLVQKATLAQASAQCAPLDLCASTILIPTSSFPEEVSCEKQGIEEGQLTIHADRGTSMKSKCLAQLLADLGVTKSHSRPHVSDDNPFSEAQFKTLKYRPEFPDRFGSYEDGLSLCREFFPWYNTEHRHSGIGMLTPEMVHYGLADAVLENRRRTLATAFAAHPERFVKGPSIPRPLPEAVWINPPKREPEDQKQEVPQVWVEAPGGPKRGQNRSIITRS